MQNVDFLPKRYHEQRNRRSSGLLVGAVGVTAVLGVLIASATQYSAKQRAAAALATVEDQYMDAIAQGAHKKQLSKRRDEIQKTAQLVTYLDDPWPMTQLLGELAAYVPNTITLTEIRIEKASGGGGNQFGPGRSGEQDQKESTGLTAAEQDLQLLAKERDASPLSIHVRGTTSSPAEPHIFLARLPASRLFRSAQLESSQSIDDEASAKASFELTIEVAPSYAQPGGPDGSKLESDPTLLAGAES